MGVDVALGFGEGVGVRVAVGGTVGLGGNTVDISVALEPSWGDRVSNGAACVVSAIATGERTAGEGGEFSSPSEGCFPTAVASVQALKIQPVNTHKKIAARIGLCLPMNLWN
jgi:hypothetical protein